MLSDSKKPILQLDSPDITAESKIALNKKISFLEDKINDELLNQSDDCIFLIIGSYRGSST